MRTSLFFLLALVSTLPFVAHGQGFVALNPTLPGIGDFSKSPSIPNLLNNIYKICIGLAAILAVLQIMRAGVLYMGGDSITEKKEAKDLIAMSLIGLLLVLAPTIVFSIINPDILKLQIGADALKTQFQDSPSDSITGSSTSSGSKTAPVDSKAIVNALANYKVVPLISKGYISTTPDPAYSCQVGAGSTFVPGTGCGPILTSYQCCVAPKK